MQRDESLRPLIAVVGDASLAADAQAARIAFEIGRGLIDGGYRLVTGGLGGVMEAASRGARSSAKWRSGDIVAVLPGSDRRAANAYVDIVVCTGLDHGRNLIVAQADALIAVGGGAGTLSEIAFAWIQRRLIVGLRCGGWSERLADQRIDERVRYRELVDDRVYGAANATDAIAIVDEHLATYSATRERIASRTKDGA